MRVIRLEIVKLLRDRRLAAAMAVFAGVSLLSAVAAWIEVRQAAGVKAAVAAEERRRWLDQGVKDPHSAAHYAIQAFKPSRSLQAVDPGIVPFVGETVWLEAHVQNDLLSRPQQDAGAFERFGLVDPSGLLTRFGPLAIFLLAFAAAARERESGVLGLALGAARTRGAYVGAKAIAVAALAALVLVLPIAIVGVVGIVSVSARTRPSASAGPGASFSASLSASVITVPGGPGSPDSVGSQRSESSEGSNGSRGSEGSLGGPVRAIDDAVRLAGWIVGALSYVGVMSMVAVAIGLTARSAQGAFAALLLAWVVFVLAAPPAATAIAAWRRPLPSFQQMKLVLTDEAPSYWTPEAGAAQIDEILRNYRVSRVGDLDRTVNVRGAQLDVAERHAQAVFDREIGGFYDRVAAQDHAYALLGWLSPAVAFDAASAALAGTDFTHHRHFIDYAERYRRDLVNRMNADLIPNPAIGAVLHTSDRALWSLVPAFDYRPLPAFDGVRPVHSALAAMTGWLAAAAALLAMAARTIRP